MQSKDSFTNLSIIDVENDGACLFHCMAFYIYTTQHQKMLTAELEKLVPEYSNEELDPEIHREISRYLQNLIKVWLVENCHTPVPDNPTMNFADLLMAVHGQDVNEYSAHYSKFAGEENYEIKEIPSKSKKSKKIKKKKVWIVERWGGAPEIIAFSEIFQCPVTIYVFQRKSKYTHKFITTNNQKNGSKPHIWATYGKSYNNEGANFLLLHKKDAHYQYLDMS